MAHICGVSVFSVICSTPLWTTILCLVLFFWVFGTYHVLKIPLLILISTIMAVEIFFYALVRATVVILEFLGKGTNVEIRRLRYLRAHAPTYKEWKKLSMQLDQITGRDRWKGE